MIDLDELIAEARQWAPCAMSPVWQLKLITKLADALEAATRERDAALARIAEDAKLHQPESFHDEPTESFCKTCQRTAGVWPCVTAIALGLNEGENDD